ncbi:MAG: response regulator [Sporichthyaceae bacterium]
MDSTSVSMLANALVALAYFGISGVILIPLLRSGQFRRNRLGAATAVIFFTCAVGHLLHAAGPLTGSAMTGKAPVAVWDVTTMIVAGYYWSLRRTYGSLMRGAVLFDDLREQQRVAAMEAAQSIAEARAEAERERAAHAEMMRLVIANSQSLIYIKDLDGRYLLANEPFQRVFGRVEADFLGRTDADLDSREGTRWREHDRRALRGRFCVEEEAFTAAGPRILESVRFPLRNPQGEVYATCGISLDVTDQRQAAQAMAEARDAAVAATAARSAFLATMSHEIRTPMNAVVGLTGLLLDTDLDAQQRDFVETVRSSGDALLEIINDILDFSKIEAGELAIEQYPFRLTELIEGAVDLVTAPAAVKGLTLVTDIDPELPRVVVGDSTRLRQVLVNLLSNAVKFTAAGEVVVTVAGAHDPGGRGVGLRLDVAVADTGIGLPVGARERLFQPFTQADASHTRVYGGTGLGLAISRRLVEAMGGTLDVQSIAGQGSTFRFDVPVATHAEDSEPDDIHLRGVRVLVVEPVERTRAALCRRLRALGAICGEATTASDALARRAQQDWDVVLVDHELRTAGGAPLAPDLRTGPARGEADPRPAALVALTKIGERMDPDLRPEFTEALARPVKVAALVQALRRALDPSPVLPAQTRPTAAPPVAVRALRVLLAEDNLVNQKVIRLMLAKLGHVVDTVSNGAEAVESVGLRPYDLVLMDVQMPVLDGLSATRRIRTEISADRQPCVIAITAGALLADRESCAAAGMDGYLAKPVREEELRKALDRFDSRPVPAVTEVPDGGIDPSVDPAGDPAAACDPAVLSELLDMLGEDHETGDGVVETYLEDTARSIPDLVLAARQGDLVTVGALAHRLKSSSLLLGARRLAALLREIETEAMGARTVPAGAAADEDLVTLATAASLEADRVAAALRSPAALR